MLAGSRLLRGILILAPPLSREKAEPSIGPAPRYSLQLLEAMDAATT
jgi:hypothetical protein